MRKLLSTALLGLCLLSAARADETLIDEDAELRWSPAYVSLATGDLAAFQQQGVDRYAWPYPPLSIGHTMASFQAYGWAGNAYFHHGLDIRGDAGTPVLSATGGTVVNVGNYNNGSRLYWEVAVLDEHGFLWQYHHVDHETIPQEIKDAFQQGTPIEAGALLGEIVDWPADAFGETFHHVHLNVIGEGGVYLNPFSFLQPLGDDQVPEVLEMGLLDAEGEVAEGDVASGSYSVYARVADLVKHQKFVVPPYELEVSVDGAAPFTVWRFDSLPGGSSRTEYVDEFYVRPGTCGNYGCRRLLVDLGFLKDGARAFPSEPGSHSLELRIRDHAGNESAASYQWTVE